MEKQLQQARTEKTAISTNDEKSENDQLNLVSLSADEGDKTKRACKEDIHSKELSKVGPLVSIEIDTKSNCEGAAHSTDSHEFKTMAADGKRLRLTDIFNKDDIYEALMQDKVVQSALSSINAHPKNFYELQRELSRDDGLGVSVFQGRPGKDPLDIFLNNNMLSNFAFHHLEGNKVAVRLLADYGSEAARNQMTQLGIALPIPAGLKNALANASSGAGGFLMKDSRANGKETSSHRNYEVED